VQATGRSRNDDDDLRAGRIRVLITDDRMPGMSGRELARIVARVYPSVRVILMSGDPESDSEESEAGLVLLSKPFSPQTLAATLRSALADEPLGPEGPMLSRQNRP
jgi:DNA-binding NtrC family response regulator